MTAHRSLYVCLALSAAALTTSAATPAWIQGTSGSVASGTSVRASFAGANTAGNLIVAYVIWDNAGTASVSDSSGNTYVSAASATRAAGSNAAAQVFYARSSGGSNTVTVTFSSAISSYGLLYLHEYSGIDLTSPVDAAVTGTGSAGAMSTAAVTTRYANDLLFAAAESNNTVRAAGTGYTTRINAWGNLTSDQIAATAGSYNATATQNGSSWILQLVAFKAATSGGTTTDTTPPSVPTGLTASAVSSSQINLSWSASTDNAGVAGYSVFRNGGQIATASGTSYSDTGLSAGTTYSYTVNAFDAAGNHSGQSAAASATTQSATGGTGTGTGTSGGGLPWKAGPTGRYLVNQSNVPVMVMGDSVQSLIENISEADAGTYFANRQSAGFNAAWVEVLCFGYIPTCRTNGSTYDGIVPFTTAGDLATPNETYFRRVDDMINLAASHGITLFLDPIPTGDGLPILRNNGTTKAYNYGVYLGTRYKTFPNIVWMSGDDFQTWTNATDDALVTAVARGIKAADPNHMHTVELNYYASSSLDDPNWAAVVNLNAAYSYYPTYAEVLNGYNHSPVVPVFMVEANYEGATGVGIGEVGTTAILRRQEYWTMLSGATGQLYGNDYLWQFKSGWQQNLNTTGVTQFKYMVSLFAARPWYSLVPDQSHTLVTAGYGSFSNNSGTIGSDTYLTAARTPDGALAMAYMPTLRTITVNMAQMAGPVTAQWYDPTSGTYSTISGSPFANSGSRQFTPAGNNRAGDGDWVLVLSASVVPDSVPPSTPTNVSAAAVAWNQITISWTASTDNVGVAGYRIYRNGALAGTSTQTSYTDSGLQPLTSYTYTVAAYDYANNASAQSQGLAINTTAAPRIPTFVQANATTPQTAQSAVTVSYGSAQTAGDTNIIAIGWYGTSGSIASVSDSRGNVYQAAVTVARSSAHSQAIYYAKNIAAAGAGANVVTVTFSAAMQYPDVRILEYGGLDQVNPFEAGASANGTGTSAASPAVTTTSANSLILGAGMTADLFTSAGSGFTSRVITSPNGDIVEDRTVSTTGSYNASGTTRKSMDWLMQVAAFRAAGQ